MRVCIKYDKKPPYLPIAVADNRQELADMLGIRRNVVDSAFSQGNSTYFEMEFDDKWWPDNNGGEWTYGRNGEVIYRD